MTSTQIQRLTEEGITYFRQGNFTKALEIFHKALEIDPGSPAVLTNIGGCHLSKGNTEKAKKYLQKALDLDAKFMQANYNLANAFFNEGNFHGAAEHYKRIIDHGQNIPNILLNLATSLAKVEKDAEAEKYFKYYLALVPEDAEAVSNLGVVVSRQGKFDEAIKHYQHAVTLNPENWDTYFNLGILYARKLDYENAVIEFEKLVQAHPTHSQALSHLVNRSPYILDWERQQKYAPLLDNITDLELKKGLVPAEQPFMSVIRRDNPRINLEIARAYSKNLEQIAALQDTSINYRKRRKPSSKKLRIGYVSDGFRDFPTAHNFVRVLELHDRTKFEVICYSHSPVDDSSWRTRITQAVDGFVDIRDLSDHEAAIKIREDNVDVLIDLKGHTKDSRLQIFAFRPAPVQISYLGFPGSTGAKFIDYAIVDKTVVPEGDEKYWSEKLIFMPHCYRSTDNNMSASPIPFEREDFSLPGKAFVFASFNSPYKLDPLLYDTWMEILKEVPGSVLWQLDDTGKIKSRLQTETKKRGIDPRRVIIAEKAAKEAHLARMKLADLILDTRIVNGHTTTVDALWAGVPVIALYGNHFCSRVSASVLKAAGLPELVTEDLTEYKELAIKLAKNKAQLKILNSKLKTTKNSSPLFNSELFTRNLEKAYEKVHARHKKRQKPANIYIHG